MWILPSNLKESFLSAQESAASSEELNALVSRLESSVTWRGKQYSAKIWLARWKRVFWLRRLSGRILDPSMEGRFVDWWTASLEATRARVNPSPENESSRTMQDTFGRLYETLSRQLDLFGAGSKTLMTTSQELSSTFFQTYGIWVTQLRQAYSRRQKLARHMRENASSSSPSTRGLTGDFWLTPRATESPETAEAYLKRMQASPDPKNNTKTRPGSLNSQVNWKTPGASETEGGALKELSGDAKYKLRDQVNWPTATAYQQSESVENYHIRAKRMKERHKGKTGNGAGMSLATAVKQENWETPQARDFRSPDLPESQNYQRKVEKGYTIDLNSQVMEKEKNFPTPMSRDYRNGHGAESDAFEKRKGEAKRKGTGVNLVEYVQREESWPTPTFAGNNQGTLQEWGGSKNPFRGGQPGPDSPNTHGKTRELSRGRLNPKWVSQLMGTTLERIFFVRSETQSLNGNHK